MIEKNKKSKLELLFILLIIIMFIGSINQILTMFALMSTCIIALNIGMSNPKEGDKICIGLVWMLCLQNLCIGIGAHTFGNISDTLKYITQIPFLTLLVIWICIQIRKIKSGKIIVRKYTKWFIAYVFCILLSLFIGRGDIKAILINIRNMLTFFFAYEIGLYYLNTEEKLAEFYQKFMKIIKIVFLLGIILMIGGYNLYKVIGIKEVYIAKGAEISAFKEDLPGRFYTRLFYTLLPRMGSIYYEPINLAYLFAFALIMSVFFYTKKRKIGDIIISGIGLILTVGKGGFFIVGLSLSMLYLSKIIKTIFKRMQSKVINIFTIFAIVVILSLFIGIYVKLFPSSSVMPHIWSIQRTWQEILDKPYGNGLGIGGNMSHLFGTGQDGLSAGEESAIMSFTYQFGIQGIFCLFMCLITLFSKSDWKNNKIQICYFLPYTILITSLFQENTYTPQCIIVYMFLLGAMQAIQTEQKESKE